MHPHEHEPIPSDGGTISAASPTKVEYVCPMHPQIVRDAPGVHKVDTIIVAKTGPAGHAPQAASGSGWGARSDIC